MSAAPAVGIAASPAAFDALYERLDKGEIFTLDAARIEQTLAQLERLRPVGDSTRDLRYRTLYCSWGFPDDGKAALAYAADGLQRARRAGDEDAAIRFHYCLGIYRPAPLQSLGDFDAGIGLSRKLESARLEADGLAARGSVHSLLGEQARAVLDLLAAQRLYERAGRNDDAEANLLNLAIAYRRMGDLDKALDYLRQSEGYAQRIGDWGGLLGSLLQQAYLFEDRGRPDAALELYERALVLAKAQSSNYDDGIAHLGMAYAHILKRDYRRALQVLDRAKAKLTAVGDTGNQDMIDLRRGQAHAGLGQHAQALSDYARAARTLDGSGNLRYLAMLYAARAASHEALGDAGAALVDLKRVLDTRQTIDDRNRDQQAQVLRYQFDAARRDLENQRLQVETTARDQQLAAMRRAQRWQWTALALAGLLLALFLSRQLRRQRSLQALAMTDTLTGVSNRRGIERFGQDTLVQTATEQQPLTVLSIDIDRFKNINDTFGHQVGDQVLVRVANACQHALRQFDRLGRVGGEEFLVVLPRTGLARGAEVGERLRGVIAALPLADVAAGLTVTISVGVAALGGDSASLKDILRRADQALYRAKQGGRNRVEVDH